MSSVRARSARHAPVKNIAAEYARTGRLNSSCHTSSRSPNGAPTVKPKTSRPIGDHNRIGRLNTAATKKRFRMSVTIAAMSWPCCAPCPAAPAASGGAGPPSPVRSVTTGSAAGSHR